MKWNTTYYWRIDEVAEDGSVVAGDVWSFVIADYIPVIDEAVTMAYDNTADPFITELAQEYAGPQNWTKNGVTSLQLDLRGGTSKFSIDGDVMSLMAAGADVWGNADEFRYAYKTLIGDGTMIARVTSNGTGSNELGQGRRHDSPEHRGRLVHARFHAPDGRRRERRQLPVIALRPMAARQTPIAARPSRLPTLLKIERIGSTFTGSVSADANEWTPAGRSDRIDMNEPVLIGLAVTSHASGELRTFQFDNVSMTGDVTGDWTVADIGVAQGGNDPAPVYVALTDAAGNTAVVTHPDNPNVAVDADWRTWKILTVQLRRRGPQDDHERGDRRR